MHVLHLRAFYDLLNAEYHINGDTYMKWLLLNITLNTLCGPLNFNLNSEVLQNERADVY